MPGFVPFAVTICGIEELPGHAAAGVSHVLSILDPDRAEPEAFGAYGEHSRLELRFHDVIEALPGWQPPEAHHIESILAFGRNLLAELGGAHLLVHCHVGVSRSTAATLLLLAQARPDQPGAAVMAEVARIRPKAWPNLRMVEMGDAALGRAGGLIDAVRQRYRAMSAANPDIARFMTEAGRGRETIGLS